MSTDIQGIHDLDQFIADYGSPYHARSDNSNTENVKRINRYILDTTYLPVPLIPTIPGRIQMRVLSNNSTRSLIAFWTTLGPLYTSCSMPCCILVA